MPVAEVERQLTTRDLMRWCAYFKLKNEREEQVRLKAEREARQR